MVATLPGENTLMNAQVPLQIEPFHEAANRN
jgi:hypothetical protein